MADRAQQSSLTFSEERVRSIYQDGRNWKPLKPGLVPPTWKINSIENYDTEEGSFSTNGEFRKHRAQLLSKKFHSAAQEIDQHISLLDENVASLLRCNYDRTFDESVIVTQACELLSRLPAVPHFPNGLSSTVDIRSLHPAFLDDSLESQLAEEQGFWVRLLVTKWHDTCTIRIALMAVQLREENDGMFGAGPQAYIDAIAEILQASSELISFPKTALEQQTLFIAQCFLWTCWSRSLMLQFHLLLQTSLHYGYDYEQNQHINLRRPFSDLAASSSEANSDYLCTWAFELLRSDRACILQDFRSFHKRFAAMHGQKPGRCVAASSHSCNGKGPKDCQRFTGMKIFDQSAHDFTCDGTCNQLIWDEASYRSVEGARAVSITDTKDALRYCQASSRTIAVSHVWAHGAGGRPHTGFNACLHRRLVRIARESSCDSYWMDTPCIPENHELRAEAISNINHVFTISFMTLLWDRDIMDIDISPVTIEVLESILCTLLVCDWNLRSWTLLESMRARHNVHLLCKDNRIISLRKCLLDVHSHGAIDVANLFLTNQQLLPAQKAPPNQPTPADSMIRRENGYISFAESMCLLAYRHASRPGDSTVIMSLLHDASPSYTAEAFWKSKVDSDFVVFTGMLFSSQPRLQNCEGFNWAPAQPEVIKIASTAFSMGTADQRQQHLLFDGWGTSVGMITAQGLDTQFATFEVPRAVPRIAWLKDSLRRSGMAQKTHLTSGNTESKAARSLSRQIWKQFQLKQHRNYLLLLPNADSTLRYHVYRGRSNGPIFAVVVSNDREEAGGHQMRWRWLGIIEWDSSVPWPRMRSMSEPMLIV